jgi:lysophospholipase L1-like esterase
MHLSVVLHVSILPDQQCTEKNKKLQSYIDISVSALYGIDNQMRRFFKMLHIYGDSVTKSIAFDEKGALKTVTDNFIKRAAEACGLALNNRSLFGATITKGRQLLKRFAKDFSPGDQVLLAYGGNDCNLPWEVISADPEASPQAKTPIKEFTAHLSATIDELREKEVEPLLMNLLPLQPKRFFDAVTQGLHSDVILQWIGDIQEIYRWQEGYSQVVMETAARKGVPLFDARSVFLSHPHYEDLLCHDGMHLNDKGQALLTDAFSQFLKTYVK